MDKKTLDALESILDAVDIRIEKKFNQMIKDMNISTMKTGKVTSALTGGKYQVQIGKDIVLLPPRTGLTLSIGNIVNISCPGGDLTNARIETIRPI